MCLWNPGIIVHWEHGFPTKANIHNRFKIFFFFYLYPNGKKLYTPLKRNKTEPIVHITDIQPVPTCQIKKKGIEPVPVILSGKWLHIL